MKELSFFLLKNSLGAKMKKGIRNFCNGDASTSTLNQHKAAGTNINPDHHQSFVIPDDSSVVGSDPYIHSIMQHNNNNNNNNADAEENAPTLEQMILQLEMEEELARKAKQREEYYGGNGMMMRGRMSCVNNSDILRSARNALNQYPRFSLDGKDAMYRSSFRNSDDGMAARKSVCCDRGVVGEYLRTNRRRRSAASGFDHSKLQGTSSCLPLPSNLGGESVVWCKPGVVAKLMGLEAMPIPINSSRVVQCKQTLSSIIKRQQHLMRRRAHHRHEMERRSVLLATETEAAAAANCEGIGTTTMGSSCSTSGYCVMKPVADVDPAIDQGGWPTLRFR
ncbi:hypothetical protein Tsubulata_020565 [Turnera subulata]|uniref:DUF3741 domain-containing protein n=1 Tax=Turnera subulata TaxID=218843 RepID=A0A9Q0JA87_9ROSI|nr:hypothetical protein Tsubulata_020565 [Turnera subulata]